MKYSDRGLVFGGRVSPLYGQLYLTITLAASIVSYMVVLALHIPDSAPQPVMLRFQKNTQRTKIL